MTSNVTVTSCSPAGSSTSFWRSGWPSVDSVTGTWRAGRPVVRITASIRTTVRTNANSSAITLATATSRSPGARRPHGVDPGVERAQEVADRAVAGVLVEPAGRRAVGDQHDAGEVAALVAAADVLERLADQRRLALRAVAGERRSSEVALTVSANV